VKNLNRQCDDHGDAAEIEPLHQLKKEKNQSE
jgi:hypothetical protein